MVAMQRPEMKRNPDRLRRSRRRREFQCDVAVQTGSVEEAAAKQRFVDVLPSIASVLEELD